MNFISRTLAHPPSNIRFLILGLNKCAPNKRLRQRTCSQRGCWKATRCAHTTLLLLQLLCAAAAVKLLLLLPCCFCCCSAAARALLLLFDSWFRFDSQVDWRYWYATEYCTTAHIPGKKGTRYSISVSLTLTVYFFFFFGCCISFWIPSDRSVFGYNLRCVTDRGEENSERLLRNRIRKRYDPTPTAWYDWLKAADRCQVWQPPLRRRQSAIRSCCVGQLEHRYTRTHSRMRTPRPSLISVQNGWNPRLSQYSQRERQGGAGQGVAAAAAWQY